MMMIRVGRLSSSSSSCGRRCVTEWRRGVSGCRRPSMESVFVVVAGRSGSSSPSAAPVAAADASPVALQRIRALTSILNRGGSAAGRRPPGAITVRYSSSSSQPGDEVITLGDVSLKLKQPENPELVPVKYKGENLPQSVLRHLRWIMQKDLLAQDVFLVGPPGPLRRNLAMMYLEMTKKEVEYVSLSRDTTETDLKQRREIVSSSAVHVDQCAVRAAIKGRVLILEGIEKAERNVLPVLNNLLENREMQLDDGRFLMAASGYDKLLQSHSKEELDSWKLVRVHEDFRVIALGLPVPWYQGNPLDPPLRSRFQARNISALPYKDHLELLKEVGEGVNPDHVSRILSFAMTMVSKETHSLGLPDFPLDNLHAIIKILRAAPSTSLQNLLERLYPFRCMMASEGQTAVRNALKSFELLETEANDSSGNAVMEIRRGGPTSGASVQLQCGHSVAEIQVPTGELGESVAKDDFIRTPYHDHLLSEMMQTHMVKDFCVIGSRGCGKSVLVRQFADLLGYHIETIMLYQDMTARDLLQQRMTTPGGDTVWRLSPLVIAALEGSLAVLDGVHRVNAGTFAVLHRLIHDRELSLFDGSRLLRHDRYDAIRASRGFSEEDMRSRGLLRIHPSFRIVALSELPVIGSSSQQWLSSELLTMFLYHHMRPLSMQEELHIIKKLVPQMTGMKQIMDLTHRLRNSADASLKSVAASLSTRQLLRIARHLAIYPDTSVYNLVHKACLSRFLPRLTQTALEEELDSVDVRKTALPSSVDAIDRAVTCEIKDGILRIGSTTIGIYNPETKMKIPDVIFYDNPLHMSVMEEMLRDYLLGEHLLLVGNQGVGKNKIIDRFLYLLNRPREYIQLHRDTTVQTLTLQPTVQDGVVVYEDSPLVRAVKQGHILVIDEADKAPTNVTCILKTLVESGEMHLADSRRIVSANSGLKPSPSIIVAHPDFRMFVLANRPGFPFLGNDFFGALGDIFSCHAIDNPDVESEMAMLRQYGPSVPDGTLRRLVLAFGELRTMADQGMITYPYSTREVVNMVKHLERFPNEGLVNVVNNVFDFDVYNKELRDTVLETLHKHGIPIGADPRNVLLAKEFPLPPLKFAGQWNITKLGDGKHTKPFSCSVEEKKLTVKGPVFMGIQSFASDRTEARSQLFTEQEAFWNLPLHETSAIVDVAVTKGRHRQPGRINGDVIHVATTSPVCLYSVDTRKQHLSCIDLYDVFPGTSARSMAYKPCIRLAPLGFPLDKNVILHEELTNTTLNINWETGELLRLETGSLLDNAAGKISRTFRANQGVFKMESEFSQDPDGPIVFFKQDHNTIDILDMMEGKVYFISLPLKIHSLFMASPREWLLTEHQSNKKFLLSHSPNEPLNFGLQEIHDKNKDGLACLDELQLVASQPLPDAYLSAALGQKIKSPNRVLSAQNAYASIGVGFPDCLSVDIFTADRTAADDHLQTFNASNSRLQMKGRIAYLPESGQVARILSTSEVPKDVIPEGVKPRTLSGFLELCDLVNRQIRYIPIPGVSNPNVYNQWYYAGFGASNFGLMMSLMSNDSLVTVDSGGCIRLWEAAIYNLSQSMKQWQSLIGQNEERPIQVTYDKELGKIPDDPKHGRIDPTGAPHMGGNTFAGGSGGMNTAGMGGAGGPYRLDGGGNAVFQVADWDKAQVPEEVLRAARELAERAWKERLKQIKMSEFDGELYERYASSVRSQIKSLRIILDSLQAKSKERQWLRHQMYGDLDEAKLIEGLAGEKGIYKRRGEKEPELGSPQQKPKLIKILCDVSGSMYRFNGQDGRLDRQLESVLMVMEAFEGYDQKIKYEVFGHSGEGPSFPFIASDKPPKNNKERLDIVLALHAHAQFCISGDHTLEATKHAVEEIAKEQEVDERFVIVLSDANLERYGIRPKKFAEILTANEEVNGFVIFIGSLGDQAQRIMKQMPSGKAFVCLDTKNLPSILQQIFTSTMLSTI